jgi:hypothetical protein
VIVDTIPCIDERGLWCSCGAKVCDFIDSKPLEYGLPGIVEPKREWWARMVTAAREAGAL